MKCNNNLENKWSGLSLESLREQERAIIDTHEWWNIEITNAAKKLEEESNKEEPNYELVESLKNKIDSLQAKGAFEERQISKFQKLKDDYLMFALLSGICTIKL